MIASPLDAYAVGNVLHEEVENGIWRAVTDDALRNRGDVAFLIAVQITENQELVLWAVWPHPKSTVMIVKAALVNTAQLGADCPLSHPSIPALNGHNATMSLDDMINEGVRRAYAQPDNVLRASIVSDPAGKRLNTKDNTPAIIHHSVVPGNSLSIDIAAKGGGSENKAKMVMLNPSDSIVEWVLKTVPAMGAGWCPPGMLGIGIGGTAEKAAVLAKESLMDSIDIHELIERGPSNRVEELRIELYHKVNQLGIGAQGLGGLTTVLDVKIKDYPTHAASLPICIIPNCAATRHIHFTLDGSGPAILEAPDLSDYPDIAWETTEGVRRVNLDTVTREDVRSWKPGETILLNGKLLTGRDAAHKRIVEMLDKGEPLPVNLEGRFIYYVGPVDPVPVLCQQIAELSFEFDFFL